VCWDSGKGEEKKWIGVKVKECFAVELRAGSVELCGGLRVAPVPSLRGPGRKNRLQENAPGHSGRDDSSLFAARQDAAREEGILALLGMTGWW